MRTPRPAIAIARRAGSILVAVLWCLVLLAMIVVSVLHTARMGLTLAKHSGDEVQARYLALAGIEKAKALLALDAKERRRAGHNYSAELVDSPDHFREAPLGRGRFSVLHPGRDAEDPDWLYGVSDEEGRLNINVAGTNELSRILGMTPGIVAAVVDWRDNDNAVSPGGAEAEYYASLNPPYLPRNGPFQTIREMLMVRGITPELLFGPTGAGRGRRRGMQAGSSGARADPRDSGWERLLTVHSGVKNVNAAGQERVNIQNADEKTLSSVKGVTPEIAKAIVAYRSRNQFQSIADLLDVTPAPQPGAIGPNGLPLADGGNQGQNGPRIISEELFADIADDVTVEAGQEIDGPVNLNSASVDVLACLPGVERPLAQSIASYRKSVGYLPSVASVLKAPGMTREIFKQILPRVTARSETYRILAEGVIPGRETRRRIEVVVRVGAAQITTLAYREDDL